MTLSDKVTMQIRRGNKADLPSQAPDGELLLVKDTQELFFGTGTGVQQIKANTDTVAIPFTNPSTVWNITHNLDKKPSVTVAISTGEVIYGDVQYVNSNQITITFSAALSGIVYLN